MEKLFIECPLISVVQSLKLAACYMFYDIRIWRASNGLTTSSSSQIYPVNEILYVNNSPGRVLSCFFIASFSSLVTYKIIQTKHSHPPAGTIKKLISFLQPLRALCIPKCKLPGTLHDMVSSCPGCEFVLLISNVQFSVSCGRPSPKP